MKTNEFCYWLQGFFEISGITELTLEQIELIKKHLELVKTQEQNLYGFPGWLAGYLDGNTQLDNNRLKTNKIQEELAKYFNHVIDKSYSFGIGTTTPFHSRLGDLKFNC